jgi:hypothetical protein
MQGQDKYGINEPMQKGQRRQKLNEKQDNVGNEKNKPQYENFKGEPIK